MSETSDKQPEDVAVESQDSVDEAVASEDVSLAQQLAERTEDLQRVQAEYVNYKKRVDRDRAQAQQYGIESVLMSLMPVFDSILAAETHGELTGGFKLTADEFVKVTKQYGFEHFGEVGDEFDPVYHEALMQQPVPGDGPMRLNEILQVGYKIGDRVIRPVRAVVSVPDGSSEDDIDEEPVADEAQQQAENVDETVEDAEETTE